VKSITLRCDYFGLWANLDGNGMTLNVFRESSGKRSYELPVRHCTTMEKGMSVFSVGKHTKRLELRLIVRRQRRRAK
jgi:hypothetical protein